MENVTYTRVSVNYNYRTSMSTGLYFCEILDLNTGILWCFDDINITKMRVIPENVYILAPYPTADKKFKNI